MNRNITREIPEIFNTPRMPIESRIKIHVLKVRGQSQVQMDLASVRIKNLR